MDFGSARGAIVMLDATELTRDWFLSGLEFRLMRFLATQAGLRPMVPSSVVAEAIANHGRAYAQARREFDKAAKQMRQRGGPSLRLGHVPERSDYDQFLAQRVDDLGIEVVEAPPTPHHEIVARAVERRPPFDENGSGYRDTLVWLTCVELARQGERVFLVSQDRDFAGRDSTLAAELAEEVDSLLGSVELVRDLRLWLTPLSPWKGITDPKEIAALARDEEVASLFAPWDMFEDIRFSASEMGLPAGAMIHDIVYHDGGGLERIRHQKNSDGADVVDYEFDISFDVELSLTTWEAVECGFIDETDEHPSSTQEVSTVVPMRGFMTVVHDERDAEDPLIFESIELLPGYSFPASAREDDPEQLRLPLDDGV